MRWLIAFLFLLVIAVAAALAAGFSKGYVLLVYPPYRLEMALSFFVVSLVVGFAALYGFIRLAIHTLQTAARRARLSIASFAQSRAQCHGSSIDSLF